MTRFQDTTGTILEKYIFLLKQKTVLQIANFNYIVKTENTVSQGHICQ